ncbi:MAG: hypothetical protein OXE99_06565 [Cellvibrionales bacterium]|nr:hypothetical protein [Cellvibrionales bacterium]
MPKIINVFSLTSQEKHFLKVELGIGAKATDRELQACIIDRNITSTHQIKGLSAETLVRLNKEEYSLKPKTPSLFDED